MDSNQRSLDPKSSALPPHYRGWHQPFQSRYKYFYSVTCNFRFLYTKDYASAHEQSTDYRKFCYRKRKKKIYNKLFLKCKCLKKNVYFSIICAFFVFEKFFENSNRRFIPYLGRTNIMADVDTKSSWIFVQW